MATDPPSRVRRRTMGVAGALLGVATAAAVFALGLWRGSDSGPLPPGVLQADMERASQRFQELYKRPASRLDTLSLLGELAVAEKNWPLALASFQAIPTEHSAYGPAARLQQAQVLLELNRAADAERNFREFLARAAGNPSVSREQLGAALHGLCYILSVELRLEEREHFLNQLHDFGMADVYDSKQRFLPMVLLWHYPRGHEIADAWRQADPDNLDLRTACARYLTYTEELEAAGAILDRLGVEHPEALTILAARLEFQFERGDEQALVDLLAQAPPYSADEPWALTLARGQSAEHRGDRTAAAEFYRMLLARDPAHPRAAMGLARVLEDSAARETALQRSLRLSRMRVAVQNVNEENAAAARALRDDFAALGMEAAARVFAAHAARLEAAQASLPAVPPGRPEASSPVRESP